MASIHMDRFNRRENGHLIHGISSPKSSSSSSSSRPDSDVDFADVFGGPPRRFSTQEFRYSFGIDDSKASPEHEDRESVLSRNPWSGMEEKPVFGSYEVVNRRRYPSYDFYDDIFRGDESHGSPTKSSDQFPLTSSPGSSFLSPVRPQPPKSDPFASSFPSQFSLPAKSTIPHFPPASSNTGGSDEASSSFPAINLQKDDDIRSETRPSYRPSPLSQENKSDQIINNNTTNSLLHFSIYKWASKGTPPSFFPFNRSNSLKSNRKYKIHRCSSSNGRIQDGGNTAEFLCQTESPETEFPAGKEGKDLNEEERKGSRDKTVNEKQEPKASKSSDDVVVQRAKLPKNDNTNHGLDDSQRRPSSENLRRNAATKGVGKVKDFVKIFSQQEDSGKLQNDIQTRTQSSSWKQHVPNSKENLHELKDQDNNKNTKREPEKQSKIHLKSTQTSFRKNELLPDSGNSLPEPSKTVDIDMDDLMEDNFQVKELPNDQGSPHEIISTIDNQDLDLDLDSKIRQWSKGKEGNIRSLLSTLQFVLWGSSGWKPVALVDIIEGNAVKRAYQRALLYLHPDKLQQKCSDPHQKYIAEKVFKILQEAWDHFNTLGAI